MRKLKNSRGFTGIEIMIVVAMIGAVSYFAAPSIGKGIHNIFEGTKNRQKSVHKVTEQYSMFYKDADGNYKPAPIPYKRTESSLNYTHAEPPETLWQKFLHLGIMIIPIIMIISYLGAWPLINFWVKKIKKSIANKQKELENSEAETRDLKDNTYLIVQSIDAGLAILPGDMKEKFLGELSKKQDSTTKKLVAELKHN